MKYLKLAFNLIGGLGGKTYATLAVVALSSATAWYFYYSVVQKPISEAVGKTVQCKKDFEVSKKLYDKALKDAGIFISQLAQKVVDVNDSMTKEVYVYKHKFNECNSTLEHLKEEAIYEKVNLDDEFFYTELPFY